MELRLKIDDAFIDQIGKKLGATGLKATDIAREALTIYKWAVDEAAKGRVVLSSDSEGTDIHKLVMHNLETLRAKSTNTSTDNSGSRWIKHDNEKSREELITELSRIRDELAWLRNKFHENREYPGKDKWIKQKNS